MKNLAKNLTKLQFLLALAAVLLLPTVVRVYAQSTTPEEPVVEEETVEEEVLPETSVPEEPMEEVIEETLPEEEIVVDPVDETDTEDDEVPINEPDEGITLDQAIIIAQAEHPGVAVLAKKAVNKHGVESYKIKFEDGWKVYVATDGTIIKVVDPSTKVRKCARRLLSSQPYNFDNKPYKFKKGWKARNHSGWKHNSWKRYRSEQNSSAQQNQTDTEEGAEVQGVSSDKKHKNRRLHHRLDN